MPELVVNLFSSGSFIPHGHCYLWQPGLVWLHILSDCLIALAYYSIPLTLLYFVYKREDLPFDWIFLLFGAFIVFCGTTHLMEVWTLWHPVYWLSGVLKAATAIISLYTAVVLVKLVPQALLLPSPAQLEATNNELQQQIRDRQQAEAQVRLLNQELEAKVAQRTLELEDSMVQVRDYVERAALAMDAARMGSWDWDLASQKVIWSAHHEILFGYQPGTAERTYEEWAQRVHPDDLAQVEAAIEMAKTNGTDFLSQYRVIWDDGSVHWVEGFGRFYRNTIGESLRMLGMVREVTERVQAREALEQSEARFRRAILESPLPIILHAEDGEIVLTNNTWNKLTGYELADIPTIEHWVEHAYGELRPLAQALLDQLYGAQEQPKEGEFSIKTRTGETRIWNFFSVPLGQLPDGRRLVMSKALDMTERKQVERELRESEERFRFLVEATTQIIWTTKAEGEIAAEQPSWSTFTGQDYEEYKGWGWLNAIHPSDRIATAQIWTAALKNRTIYQVEHRVRRHDSEYRYMNARAVPIAAEDGSIREWIGIHMDITARKQVEESLKISEERLRLATEASDIGMWFWNLREDQLVWTTRCKTLFGLDPNTEMSYECFLNALHPEDREVTHAAVMQAIADKVEYNTEYRSIWPDGSVHWIIAKGRAFYSESDQPIRMMGMAQDITDRKQAEFALQKSTQELSQINHLLMQSTALVNQRNQELDQFAHIVSHDLKAPLRAIANLSEWIEEDLAGQVPPGTQKHLELLRSRVYRMEALINGLLAYARVGHQDASAETFALSDLLDEIVDSLDVPPTFNVQIPSDLPTLTTNRLMLSQVFTNLISNAIKHHNRRNGQVQITAQAQAKGYEFTVSDDGPGIAPKNHERVFEVFRSLTSCDPKESTGIGLAIVKKIIEREGGQIHLESQVGKGATFRFTWFSSPNA